MAQGKLQEVPVAHHREHREREVAVASLSSDQRSNDLLLGARDGSTAGKDAPMHHAQETKFARLNLVGLSGAQKLAAVLAAVQGARQRAMLDGGAVKGVVGLSGCALQVKDAGAPRERDVFGDVLAVVLDA